MITWTTCGVLWRRAHGTRQAECRELGQFKTVIHGGMLFVRIYRRQVTNQTKQMPNILVWSSSAKETHILHTKTKPWSFMSAQRVISISLLQPHLLLQKLYMIPMLQVPVGYMLDQLR